MLNYKCSNKIKCLTSLSFGEGTRVRPLLIKDFMIMWKNLKLASLMKRRSHPLGKGDGGLGHFSFYGCGHSFCGAAYEKISPELVMPIPALTIVCSKLQHPLTCGATGAGIATGTSAAGSFTELFTTLYKTKTR